MDGIAYQAIGRVAPGEPDTLKGVTATNVSRRSRQIDFGHGALIVVIYRDQVRVKPVWDEARFQEVCLLYLASRDLAPGESAQPREFASTIPIDRILGDSLPPGSYFVAARMDVDNHTFEVPVGGIELNQHLL